MVNLKSIEYIEDYLEASLSSNIYIFAYGCSPTLVEATSSTRLSSEGSSDTTRVLSVAAAPQMDAFYGNRVKIGRGLPVNGLDGCKHLVPRRWLCAATSKATAYAPLPESIQEVLRRLQQQDTHCKEVKLKLMGKRDSSGQLQWTVDSEGLLL